MRGLLLAFIGGFLGAMTGTAYGKQMPMPAPKKFYIKHIVSDANGVMVTQYMKPGGEWGTVDTAMQVTAAQANQIMGYLRLNFPDDNFEAELVTSAAVQGYEYY